MPWTFMWSGCSGNSFSNCLNFIFLLSEFRSSKLCVIASNISSYLFKSVCLTFEFLFVGFVELINNCCWSIHIPFLYFKINMSDEYICCRRQRKAYSERQRRAATRNAIQCSTTACEGNKVITVIYSYFFPSHNHEFVTEVTHYIL